jgi:hypothetical protein
LSREPSACVSVDLDALRCYTAIHGFPDPDVEHDPVLHKGLTRFLELFEQEGIRATFFCVGRDLSDPSYAGLLSQAASAGHELANHTENHFYDLRSRSESTIQSEISACEERLNGLSAERCVGFRTPGYNLSPAIAQVLAERDYLYDSSVFPCPPYYAAKGAVMGLLGLIGRPSRSQMTLAAHLTAPRCSYRMDPSRPFSRAVDAKLWQIPVAVSRRLRLPIIGTTLRWTGVPNKDPAFRGIFNLEFHAIDLVDASDLGIPAALVGRQRDLRTSVAQKRDVFRRAFSSLRSGYAFRRLRDAL